MSIIDVEKFYDKNAYVIKNRYQPYNAIVLDRKNNIHFEKLFAFSELKNNVKVLDIGCGNGFLLNQVTNKFSNCELHGLDISQNQLSLCQNIKTYHADMQNIKINEKFDYIFCMETIGYASNQTEVINNILSMLKINGIFICSSFGYENIDTWQQNILTYKISSVDKEDGYYYNQISLKELEKYNIETYDGPKEINYYYFNFAETRGLFWKKQEVLRKHILFKIKAWNTFIGIYNKLHIKKYEQDNYKDFKDC